MNLKRVTARDMINALTILIKHDLVKVSFKAVEWKYQYAFDADQCLLRLSLPRFFIQLQKAFQG